MRSEVEEDLAALRAASHTTPPEKVIELLEKYGFTEAVELPTGRTFAHVRYDGPSVTIPKKGPLYPGLVKRVANAIEEAVLDEA